MHFHTGWGRMAVLGTGFSPHLSQGLFSEQNGQGGTGGPVWPCPVSCPSRGHRVSCLRWGVPDLRRYGRRGHQNCLRGSSPSESGRGAAQSWAPRSSAGSHLPTTPGAVPCSFVRSTAALVSRPLSKTTATSREPKSMDVWSARKSRDQIKQQKTVSFFCVLSSAGPGKTDHSATASASRTETEPGERKATL